MADEPDATQTPEPQSDAPTSSAKPRRAASSADRATGPSGAEPQLTVAGWKARARSILGVSPHAVVGALHGEDSEATFSQGEVGDRVERWLEREVQSA